MRRNRLLLPALLMFVPPLAAQSPDGIDPRNLDTTVAACTDFYRHANGGWLQRVAVPRGMPSFGLLDELERRHRQRELALIGELATDAARTGEPLADFVASGLDEATIEAAGRRQIDPLLAEFAKIGEPPKQVPALIAALQSRGLPVLFRVDVAEVGGKRMPIVFAGGLGLPDRDFYLREDGDTRDLLGRYRTYIEQLLTAAGSTDPAGEAAWVLDAEMRLARGWPGTTGNPAPPVVMTPRELRKRYPAFDWRDWIKAHDLKKQDAIAVADPAFFTELDSLVANAHPVQWRALLRFRVAHLLAPFLSGAFVDAHDGLFQRALRGRSDPRERSEQVLEATRRVLGPAFDAAMLQRYLPPADRQAAEAMVVRLRDTLGQRLASVPWLPDGERAAALTRLEQLSVEIAAPADAGIPEGLRFDRARYSENVLNAAARLQRDRLASLDARGAQALSRPQSTPPMAAQYDPRSNKLQLGLALLQPPLFQPQDPALTWGALGALLGHELMHGFDLAGAAWAGQTPDPARIEAWQRHTLPLVAQYNGMQALGQAVDGSRTLPENAADVGGLELAWHAWSAADPGPADIGGHSAAQRFFLGWAQLMRRNYRDDELLRLLRDDRQPPSEFRVNGPLAHLPTFAGAFGCKSGQPMVRDDAARLQMFP